MAPDVRLCADVTDLNARAATVIAATISDAVRRHGRCRLALTGGRTPRALYTLLASTYRDQIPWAHVLVYWGDERYVPPDDADSNYGMARETLLNHVPCPAGNIHPMPTSFASPDAAARDYERTLREQFDTAWPQFDLLLLGLGAEGHTASLFPGSPALDETTRWVVAVQAPAAPPVRLTLTLPALVHAASIHVLAAGAEKATALHRALTDPPDPHTCPASAIRSAEGTVTWWVDRAAASQLTIATTP